MKYSLLLHFRRAIFTLIVPSALLASTEVKGKKLGDHIELLCDEFIKERFKQNSNQNGNNNSLDPKAYKPTFFLLSNRLPINIHNSSDKEEAKILLKSFIISKLTENNKNPDFRNTPSLSFIEFYAGNKTPLDFCNFIGDSNKKWDDLISEYVGKLDNRNFKKTRPFLENYLTKIEEKLNKKSPKKKVSSLYVLKEWLKASKKFKKQPLIKELFEKHNKYKTQISFFKLIAEDIVYEKGLIIEDFLNKIAKINSAKDIKPLTDEKSLTKENTPVHNKRWKKAGSFFLLVGFVLSLLYGCFILLKDLSKKKQKNIPKKSRKTYPRKKAS